MHCARYRHSHPLLSQHHNIFKILHIDYVRRLNYLDHPDANKWGVRFMVMMTF